VRGTYILSGRSNQYRKEVVKIEILTKLANIYLDLNEYNWDSFVPEIAEKYKHLSYQEQNKYVSIYHNKIKELLNNPADTIISWQHFIRLGKSFDKWLLFKFQD